ncbi:MAG: glycosyltransferase [Acidobacteria bacterium]|nr:glycosyltransferase [Acidobacteriota bacterium]
MTSRRVCIVTPAYLASTPRVVREADALAAAGYRVRVVFTQGPIERLRAFDDALIAERAWRADAFKWSADRAAERRAFQLTGVRHRVARCLSPGPFDLPGLAERGEGRIYPELARLAAREPADLFIGHYPAGLAAAAWAARRHAARLGYDVEDLHADIVPDAPEWQRPRARILTVERRYVPACVHLTAASGPMADAFAARYGTARPVVVHNCHPWAERAAMDGRVIDRTGAELSLFWFSQTIGQDRGIQDAIRAMGRVRRLVQIHLRGSIDDGVRRTLLEVASAAGVGARVHFHPPCAPRDLLSRAAEHDVGLALEVGDSLNKRLTVSNKLFLYLTAGLAVAATDVPGQQGVADTVPAAVATYSAGDIGALGQLLDGWASDPDRLSAATRAALDAARTRWNMEAEAESLVRAVGQCFTPGVPAAVHA